MKEFDKLKWFWRLNYLLTFYKVLILISLLIPIIGIKSKIDWFEYLNFGGVTFLFSYFGEWFQFSLCLLVIILNNKQRTTFHFLYLLLLLLLALLTFIVYGILLGSLGDM